MYKIYFWIKRLQKKIKHTTWLYKVLCKIEGEIEAYYNILIPKYYEKTKNKSKLGSKNQKERIIVSLTSFPKRIDTLWITIESLLRQSLKPDEIILWLAEEQFPDMKRIPKRLLELKDRGLTIRYCDDLRSHKKYYYALQEFTEDYVILVDDDMVYPRDTIKKLMRLHKKYPQDICCMSGQVMETTSDSLPSQWRNPLLNEKLYHRLDVQIYTGSGSLYPPHCMHQDAFDKQVMLQLCPYADDLWLTYMAHKNNTHVTVEYPWRAFPITIYGTAADSLWYVNAEQGKNDQQWEAVLNYYKQMEL